jgi:hypothetical protein
MGLARPTAFVRETFADASELAERILSGNARRLLGARVGLSA